MASTIEANEPHALPHKNDMLINALMMHRGPGINAGQGIGADCTAWGGLAGRFCGFGSRGKKKQIGKTDRSQRKLTAGKSGGESAQPTDGCRNERSMPPKVVGRLAVVTRLSSARSLAKGENCHLLLGHFCERFAISGMVQHTRFHGATAHATLRRPDSARDSSAPRSRDSWGGGHRYSGCS